MSFENVSLAPPLLGMTDAEVSDWWLSSKLANRRPEGCEEFASVDTRPPENVVPYLIAEAQVRPEWADSSRLGCNACSTRNKFASGGYVAHYGDGYLYVIGPICGSQKHQKNVKLAKREYEERLYREIADDRVRNFSDNLDVWNQRLRLAAGFRLVQTEFAKVFRSEFDSDYTYKRFLSHIEQALIDEGGRVGPFDPAGHWHQLVCKCLFNGKTRYSKVVRITERLARDYGCSFMGTNQRLIYTEENVRELSEIILELDQILTAIEKEVKLVRDRVKDDVIGLARCCGKKAPAIRVAGSVVSAGYNTEDYWGTADYVSLSYDFEKMTVKIDDLLLTGKPLEDVL